MSSGQDLVNALREQRALLIDCVDAMKVLGRKLAEAEYKYRIAYRKEVFRLHTSDSVAWTACSDLAKGDEINFDVSKLRFKRDVYKSDYDTALEKINAVKLEMRLLEGEIREERGVS
jgi:hypothetical protein